MLNFYCQMIKLIKNKASKNEVLEIINKSYQIEVFYLTDALNCKLIGLSEYKIMEIIDTKKIEIKNLICSSVDSIYIERERGDQKCFIQAINFDETF
jgi:hypothetical protein